MTARSMALPRALPGGASRRRLRILAIAFLAGAAVAVGWSWLRDSSLVAVERVTVTGASGPEAANVRRALETAARDMSTLHVRRDQLATAAAPYPIVKSVSVKTDFPHGLRITVHEHDAIGAVIVDGRRTPVSSDGTLLRDTPARGLPLIPLTTPPAGDRVAAVHGLHAVGLLAAAPDALRRRVAKVVQGPKGLTATLRQGPPLYFGTAHRAAAKWAAAARVLSDSSAAGATYLDLRVPERPAAGGLEQIAQQTTDESQATAPVTPSQPSTGG